MTDTNSKPDLEQPTHVIVDSWWAEDLFAQGLLDLAAEQIDQLATSPTISLPAEMIEPFMKPKVRKSPIEWVDPLDAVHWLSPHVGGDANAKLAIAERLRDGAVKSRCLWMSEEPDVGPLSSDRPKKPESPGQRGTAYSVSPVLRKAGATTEMGGHMWNFSDDWKRDFERWNWSTGLFVTSRRVPASNSSDASNGSIAIRTVASRVRFDRDDIERIVEAHSLKARGGSMPSPEIAAQPAKEGNTRGRPRSASWSNFVAEMVVYAHWVGIEHETDLLDLFDAVKDRLERRKLDCPKYKTVESAISTVKSRFLEEEFNQAREAQARISKASEASTN